MARMTLDDLRTLLIACAGADEGSDLSGDILDTPFEDLGYDSLALMETAARIEKSHVAAVACRGNAGDGTSSDLNEDAREVRADEDVRIPLCLEFGVLLAAVEDDVLEYHGNGSRNERRSDEETC